MLKARPGRSWRVRRCSARVRTEFCFRWCGAAFNMTLSSSSRSPGTGWPFASGEALLDRWTTPGREAERRPVVFAFARASLSTRNLEVSSLTVPAPVPREAGASSGPAGSGRACAKVILLGEHAVVYGAPALAVPVPELPVSATATWSAARRDEIAFVLEEPVDPLVMALATAGLDRLTGKFKGLAGVDDRASVNVRIDCRIPLGRGLGASAAHARAAALALADLFGCRLEPGELYELVQTAEMVAHGTASGVDAAAVGATAPILFCNGAAERVRVGVRCTVVIADSGVAGGTKDAIDLLRRGFAGAADRRADFVRRAARLTRAAVRDLEAGRAWDLGTWLTAGHELLRAAGLSTQPIDRLVDAALDAGSLGAKITGGGLGGCMIALTSGPDAAQAIARRLENAGAVRTWTAPLGRCSADAG
ncbi:mevalonate kinase [Amycolatopsis sp. NPDC054798]